MIRKARRSRLAPRVETLEGRVLLSGVDVDPSTSLFVRFRDGVSPSKQTELIRSVDGSIVSSYQEGPSLIQVASEAARVKAIRLLATNRAVRYVEPNATLQVTATIPNDPGFSKQPGLDSANNVDINATTAWDTTQGNPSTIVAVIDSGLDTSHPEFAGRLWVNTAEANGVPGVDDDGDGLVDDINGWSYSTNTNNVYDDNGHGTHVSGIIAATGNNGVGVAGVNWQAKIMPIKFIGADGNGSVDDAIKAIYYAVDHGARVINASWGGGDHIKALTDAISYANDHNVVFVTAAGNESVNNGLVKSYPANDRLPNVISVAALDPNGFLASFSNYGSTTVDIAAPGVNIRSTVPGGYATYSGTSMAAPYVTGVVSLLVGLHPEMKAFQIVQRVLNAARPLPGLQGKVITDGVVDAANTVSDAYAAAHPGNFSVQKAVRLRRLRRKKLQIKSPKKNVKQRDIVIKAYSLPNGQRSFTVTFPHPDVETPPVDVEVDAE